MRIKVRIAHNPPEEGPQGREASSSASIPPPVPRPKAAPSSGNQQWRILIPIVLFLFSATGILLYIEQILAPKYFPVRTLFSFSGANQPCGPFKAWDIALAPQVFALSDQGDRRILLFDRMGVYRSQITEEMAGPPPFKDLSGLTTDPQGNLYVLDSWNSLIRGFNPQGKPILTVDLSHKSFFGPRNLVWDKGSFLVADTGNHRLVRVSTDGDLHETWGRHGGDNGQMNNPTALGLDLKGNIYFADSDNFRVQCETPAGEYRWSFRLDAKMTGVAVDDLKRRVYVSGGKKGIVEALTLDGKDLGTLAFTDKKEKAATGLVVFRVTEEGDLVVGRGNEVLVLQPATNGPNGK